MKGKILFLTAISLSFLLNAFAQWSGNFCYLLSFAMLRIL